MSQAKRDCLFLALSALWGFLGVIGLAMGAHISPLLSTAGSFLLWHAVVVMAVLALKSHFTHIGFKPDLALLLLLSGSAIFALELTLHALSGQALAILAPIGGLLTLSGWLVLLYIALKGFVKTP